MKTIELKQTGYSFTIRFEPPNKHYNIISSPVQTEYCYHYHFDGERFITKGITTIHEFISAN